MECLADEELEKICSLSKIKMLPLLPSHLLKNSRSKDGPPSSILPQNGSPCP
uniref:Uncharacterized protein n=1 Tax=Amphimedon queenslandica TaxID=400682 RepID=A0A1X7TY95_AMPQE